MPNDPPEAFEPDWESIQGAWLESGCLRGLQAYHEQLARHLERQRPTPPGTPAADPQAVLHGLLHGKPEPAPAAALETLADSWESQASRPMLDPGIADVIRRFVRELRAAIAGPKPEPAPAVGEVCVCCRRTQAEHQLDGRCWTYPGHCYWVADTEPALRARVAELEDQLAAANARAEQLKTTLDDTSNAFLERGRRLADKIDQVQHLEQQLAAANARVAELEQPRHVITFDAYDRVVAERDEAVRARYGTTDALRIRELDARLEKVKAERDEARELCAKLEKIRDSLAKDFLSEEMLLAAARGELEGTKQLLDVARNEVQRLLTQLSEARAEVGRFAAVCALVDDVMQLDTHTVRLRFAGPDRLRAFCGALSTYRTAAEKQEKSE